MNTESQDDARISAIFNEWARQYAEDPEAFESVLDENGQPHKDYGQKCAAEFKRIAGEIDARVSPPAVARVA